MIDQSSITKIKLSKGVYAMLLHPKAFRPDVLLATTRYHLDGGTIFGILFCVTNLAILLLLKLNHDFGIENSPLSKRVSVSLSHIC